MSNIDNNDQRFNRALSDTSGFSRNDDDDENDQLRKPLLKTQNPDEFLWQRSVEAYQSTRAFVSGLNLSNLTNSPSKVPGKDTKICLDTERESGSLIFNDFKTSNII